jgi:CheY-like chemotaxis protein
MALILVAEDSPALRLLYTIWLEGEGHEVVAVADGRAAIVSLERGRIPDAAVLDVEMPYVDGLSVCRYVRMRAPAVPIVIVSGVDGVRAAALAAGASTVLAKPFSPAELTAAVCTLYARLSIV